MQRIFLELNLRKQNISSYNPHETMMNKYFEYISEDIDSIDSNLSKYENFFGVTLPLNLLKEL